jgi:hypothetical protein
MLDVQPSPYRERVVQRLNGIAGAEFARAYWDIQFPALLCDRGYAAQALNPPRNKLERLISTSEIDRLLRHLVALDLEGILERGEILLLLIDGAHNVLTPSVAKMLAEGRSAGLEAMFAWQYSAQIRDEVIRSGMRSLLQSLSIFRMRELEDARSLAGLASGERRRRWLRVHPRGGRRRSWVAFVSRRRESNPRRADYSPSGPQPHARSGSFPRRLTLRSRRRR